MLALMMMDVGCWDAELLSWEALVVFSLRTFPQMSHSGCDVRVCVCACLSHRNTELEWWVPKLHLVFFFPKLWIRVFKSIHPNQMYNIQCTIPVHYILYWKPNFCLGLDLNWVSLTHIWSVPFSRSSVCVAVVLLECDHSVSVSSLWQPLIGFHTI